MLRDVLGCDDMEECGREEGGMVQGSIGQSEKGRYCLVK